MIKPREYRYLADRSTDLRYKDQPCRAVVNRLGKCIRGRNGNMLVEFSNGRKVVVQARLLRKLQTDSGDQ